MSLCFGGGVFVGFLDEENILETGGQRKKSVEQQRRRRQTEKRGFGAEVCVGK